MQRFIGKSGFGQYSRSCCRSVYDRTYSWVQHHERQHHTGGVLWESIRSEVLATLLLLPTMQLSFTTSFCERVESNDASPGGHGRAWTRMGPGRVQTICRLAEGRGVYTNVDLEFGLDPEDVQHCPMKQVSIPADDDQWTKAGRPGGYSHINLEEASALVWSAHGRFRRPHGLHTRALHLVDSTAVAGAAKKGRSASRALNACMRQLLAISVAGDLELFFAWVASGENPSDDPSSWYGIRRLKTQHVRPSGIEKIPNATDTTKPVVDPACPLELLARDAMGYGVELVLRGPSCSYLYFFHFCSGFRRYQDVVESAQHAFARDGYLFVCIGLDPVIHERLDCFSTDVLAWVVDTARAGRCVGALGSPPCSTWPKARRKEIPNGPRPLRSRENFLECLPGRSLQERKSCEVGTGLFLLTIWLLGCVASSGGWFGLEHPKDYSPPSIFATAELLDLQAYMSGRYISFHQCLFGAVSVKSTGFLTNGSALYQVLCGVNGGCCT